MDYLKKLNYLNRYSQFKNRTHLIYFLSALQLILAVGLLIWFLSPRIATYLTASPKGYLVQNFKPNIRYVLAKSDIVGGTATSSAYVKVILKEPKIVLRAKATKQGAWLVKIPQKIPEKSYRMQIITFDSQGKNPTVKQVKVKVESNNVVYRSQAYKNFQRWYTSTQKLLTSLKLA
jgi:hypothetical protein